MCVGSQVVVCVGSQVFVCVGSQVVRCVGSQVVVHVGSRVVGCVGSQVVGCVGSQVVGCVGSRVVGCVGGQVVECVGRGAVQVDCGVRGALYVVQTQVERGVWPASSRAPLPPRGVSVGMQLSSLPAKLGGGGDVRSARFPRVAKHTHVDYHQSMLLRSTRMQPHLHGPQYRSVMRIGVTRTMAHDKGAHDSLGCGAVLQYHMFYSLIVSCTTASPCRAGMHYIPIVSCRHVLQPNRVVQACATAQSCRAGMAQ